MDSGTAVKKKNKKKEEEEEEYTRFRQEQNGGLVINIGALHKSKNQSVLTLLEALYHITMFKKAKRCNFRRRNDSENEEKEGDQQSGGPGAEDSANPSESTSTGPAPGANMLNSHGNGFQPGAVKSNKEKKRKKENREEPKASLLSFHDDEDEAEMFRVKKSNHSKKIVKLLKKEYKEDLEKTGSATQDQNMRIGGPAQNLSIKEEPLEGSSEQGEEEMEVDSTEEQEEEGEEKPAGGAFSQTLSTLSSLRPGEIPDAAFIHAARKRRQMARELGGEPPLVENDVTNKRLAREDENGGSDDEDEKRIVFSGVTTKTQRQKIAEEIGIECSDDEALDNGQDEEVSRWEQEQIRKGISIPQPYGASYGMPFSYAPATVGADNSKPLKAEPSVPYPIPSCDLTPITTDLVKKRLKDRLSFMRQGHNSNARRFEQIREELEASKKTIQLLEGSSQEAADKYRFLQEMRGYVGDLLECFSEKVPVILELEVAMHQLLRQRASRLVQRRQDDIKDESSEFSSLSIMNSVLILLNRTRRRQAREQNGKRAEHKEGLSSDDEETSTDITSFNAERDRILKESKKVFEDVVEDFHSLDNIKSHFETWRKLYFTCYRDAYIGLCLPKLFNPLIRLQLISWSPLEVECPNFEYMLWFESLLFYGCGEQSALKKEEDTDNSLLPAIVERVLLPKLAVLTDQVWDPLSSSQTSRLVTFMQRLIKDYPTVLHGDNRNTQLFGNILTWDGILSPSVLKELAIDSTLNRYILSALQTTDVSEEHMEKCRRVVECFPVQWFSILKGQQTLPQLENFCRYLKHLASSLYRSCVAGSDVEKRNVREHIKEVVRLLGRLNALDHVIAVASEHGIKDIKTLLENK
ncbi:hypothetical protein cypCar_00016430 [Cyprinus carpio]|nr:hypothetical protein cypCar_00016430 [Cyprinus carpio]